MRKKVLSLTMAALLIVSCCALLVSCSGGNDVEGTKWVLDGGEMAGITLSAEDLADKLGEYIVEFNSEGKAVITVMGQQDECTYTVDGNNISLTDSSNTLLEFIRDGDNMSMTKSGVTIKFKKA